MGVTTVLANDTADAKDGFATRKLNGTVVITMNGKASGVSTRASKLVELKVID